MISGNWLTSEGMRNKVRGKSGGEGREHRLLEVLHVGGVERDDYRLDAGVHVQHSQWALNLLSHNYINVKLLRVVNGINLHQDLAKTLRTTTMTIKQACQMVQNHLMLLRSSYSETAIYLPPLGKPWRPQKERGEKYSPST